MFFVYIMWHEFIENEMKHWKNAYFIYIPTLSKGPFVKSKQPIEIVVVNIN